MKRALFDTVTVLPFASGNVVDRTGYESAVLAVTVKHPRRPPSRSKPPTAPPVRMSRSRTAASSLTTRSMRMARPSSRTKPKLRLWRTSTLT